MSATSYLEKLHDGYRSPETIRAMYHKEFIPTAISPDTSRLWMGKYRCMWCKSTGYPGDFKYWWGHRHGKKCWKRPVEARFLGE